MIPIFIEVNGMFVNVNHILCIDGLYISYINNNGIRHNSTKEEIMQKINDAISRSTSINCRLFNLHEPTTNE